MPNEYRYVSPTVRAIMDEEPIELRSYERLSAKRDVSARVTAYFSLALAVNVFLACLLVFG